MLRKLADNVLEFKSKTRSLRVPLSKQGLALLDLESEGPMLEVGASQVEQPLSKLTESGARNDRPDCAQLIIAYPSEAS